MATFGTSTGRSEPLGGAGRSTETLGGMCTCGMTRLLIPAFLVGLAVATFAERSVRLDATV
jgi:hypothetical protein